MKMPLPGEPPAAAGVPLAPQGIRAVLDSALAAAAFSFPVPTNRLPERSGHGLYYLETDADGLVAHVLLLSPRTEAMPVLERALSRGQARGAARGTVELLWNYSKP
jgi:hypothetical protein